MKKLLILILLSFLMISQSSAKNLIVLIQNGNKEATYREKLEKEMAEIGYAMITYSISQDKTIDENATAVNSIVKSQREQQDSLNVFLLSDKEASYVALDVLSKDTDIVALIAFSGAFRNGDEYLYNKASVRKNMESLDEVLIDGEKENYLNAVYNMIASARQGKKTKLPSKADKYARDLYALLNSRYGQSILNFSPDEYYDKIRSWIVPYYNGGKEASSEMYLNAGKLSYQGAGRNLKFADPFNSYSDDYVSYEVKKRITTILQENKTK